MTNKRSVRKALSVSVAALILCFAMLLGTTFAWFTDTAYANVNTIQAGTLDVALEMKTDDGWTSAEGKTLDFVKAAGHEDEPILWEPGCTYTLPQLHIVNKGNLALKYKVVITGIKGDAKLNEAIVWTFDGLVDGEGNLAADETSNAITISGHMKETAGNEYQGLTIEGIAITVYATQDTVEYDSNDNQYDAGAEFPIMVTAGTVADPDWYDAEATELLVEDAADFLAFMETAYTWGVANKPNVPDFSGKTIKLNVDIAFANGYLWTPISPYDSMYLGNGGFKGTFDGQGHTIYNLNVTNNNKTGRGYRIGLFGEVGDGAVFKNLTLDGVNTYAGNSSAGALCALTRGNVTFENITVRNSTVRQGRYAGGIVGDICGTDETTVTFRDCTVENSAIFNIHNNYCGALYGAKDTDVNIATENCTVTNVVKHFFKDASGAQDWDTFHYISLADALTAYASEPAGFGGN